MNSNIPFEKELFFLGNREYVQAPNQLHFTILSIMEKHGLTDCSRIKIKRYKQISEVRSLVTLLENVTDNQRNDIQATFNVAVNNEPFTYHLLPLSGKLSRKPDAEYLFTDLHIDQTGMIATATIHSIDSFLHLLNEVVQITKELHISCYNRDRKGFTFVVGGFENLTCFVPKKKTPLAIRIMVKKSLSHNDTLYNQTHVTIRQEDISNTFILPFIGKPMGTKQV